MKIKSWYVDISMGVLICPTQATTMPSDNLKICVIYWYVESIQTKIYSKLKDQLLWMSRKGMKSWNIASLLMKLLRTLLIRHLWNFLIILIASFMHMEMILASIIMELKLLKFSGIRANSKFLKELTVSALLTLQENF